MITKEISLQELFDFALRSFEEVAAGEQFIVKDLF